MVKVYKTPKKVVAEQKKDEKSKTKKTMANHKAKLKSDPSYAAYQKKIDKAMGY